jgi:signal transduction histidine kinase
MKRLDSIALWIALGLLAVALGLGINSTIALVDNAAWVSHTHRVIESLDQVAAQMSAARSARRGYSLTGDGEQLEAYVEAVRAANAAVMRVRLLTVDNPDQQRRLDELEPLLASRIARLDAAIEYRRSHGFEAEREARLVREGTLLSHELFARIADLAAEERRLLVGREQRTANSVLRAEWTEAIGACVSLALVVTVVVRLRREVRRRETSEETVRESALAIEHLNGALERRVEERTAELEMANRELESFSYSVVHDLRAPLRGIGGFAEVLLGEYKDALSVDALDCLREIHDNARKMATLIDALTSLSRITRGELRRANVDLSGLVRVVADQIAAREARPPPVLVLGENLRADADPSLVRTLFEILLGNAWKFTSKKAAPRIEFGMTEVEGERVLFVRDNGDGFDMSHRDKLFTPFGRLHTVQEFPGVGIGLATAQRIIQRHGGRIWADGQVGEGAAMHFTLCPRVDWRTA